MKCLKYVMFAMIFFESYKNSACDCKQGYERLQRLEKENNQKAQVFDNKIKEIIEQKKDLQQQIIYLKQQIIDFESQQEDASELDASIESLTKDSAELKKENSRLSETIHLEQNVQKRSGVDSGVDDQSQIKELEVAIRDLEQNIQKIKQEIENGNQELKRLHQLLEGQGKKVDDDERLKDKLKDAIEKAEQELQELQEQINSRPSMPTLADELSGLGVFVPFQPDVIVEELVLPEAATGGRPAVQVSSRAAEQIIDQATGTPEALLEPQEASTRIVLEEATHDRPSAQVPSRATEQTIDQAKGAAGALLDPKSASTFVLPEPVRVIPGSLPDVSVEDVVEFPALEEEIGTSKALSEPKSASTRILLEEAAVGRPAAQVPSEATEQTIDQTKGAAGKLLEPQDAGTRILLEEATGSRPAVQTPSEATEQSIDQATGAAGKLLEPKSASTRILLEEAIGGRPIVPVPLVAIENIVEKTTGAAGSLPISQEASTRIVLEKAIGNRPERPVPSRTQEDTIEHATGAPSQVNQPKVVDNLKEINDEDYITQEEIDTLFLQSIKAIIKKLEIEQKKTIVTEEIFNVATELEESGYIAESFEMYLNILQDFLTSKEYLKSENAKKLVESFPIIKNSLLLFMSQMDQRRLLPIYRKIFKNINYMKNYEETYLVLYNFLMLESLQKQTGKSLKSDDLLYEFRYNNTDFTDELLQELLAYIATNDLLNGYVDNVNLHENIFEILLEDESVSQELKNVGKEKILKVLRSFNVKAREDFIAFQKTKEVRLHRILEDQKKILKISEGIFEAIKKEESIILKMQQKLKSASERVMSDVIEQILEKISFIKQNAIFIKDIDVDHRFSQNEAVS